MTDHVTDGALIVRVLVGFALAFATGFERELRGSAAGCRTFSVVGTASAAVAAVASGIPQVLAGIITGVGFLGGGVILHNPGGSVPGQPVTGITTAATIFAAAVEGVVVGTGHLLLAVIVTALVLGLLEMPHIPVIRRLDARTYAPRFAPDRGSRADQAHP